MCWLSSSRLFNLVIREISPILYNPYTRSAYLYVTVSCCVQHYGLEIMLLLSQPLYQQDWFFVLFCFVLFVFLDRVSLCSSGCPGTHSVDQAGLELRNPPASASQVLGSKACTTTAQFLLLFLKELFIYFMCIYEHTVVLFRHTRRGHQISLQMVVSTM